MPKPTVAPELLRLTELFTGHWQGDETLYPTAWDPTGGSATATWDVRPAVEGFALLVDYAETRDGSVVYRGHGVHGWDPAAGGFLAYWFDSVGALQAAGSPATLEGDRYTYRWVRPGGHTRFTYDWSQGELVFTIDRSPDGVTWTPMHVGRYRRQ